jgi:hypothetical protein
MRETAEGYEAALRSIGDFGADLEINVQEID